MPTLSQRAISKQIRDSLTKREMVCLWGNPNGKTNVFYEMMGKMSIGVDGKLRSMLKASHSENYTLEFLEGVEVPMRSDRVCADIVRRQILRSYGTRPKHDLEMRRQYIHLLADLETAKIMPVVAMDEIQLLPERGFSVVKVLNEQHVGGKQAGPAFLLSGVFSKRRMPPNFWAHCKEVQIGKIKPSEVQEFIETIEPGSARFFTANAHKKLSECATTLEMSAQVRRAIEYFRDKELADISSEVITRVSDRATYARNKVALA